MQQEAECSLIKKHKKFTHSLQEYFLTTLGMELHGNISLPQAFIRTAQTYRERPALFDKVGGTFQGISYGEFHHKIELFANALLARGAVREEKVALFIRNSSTWAISDFGTLFAAGVTVPIYETLSGQLIEFILEESEATTIVVENNENLAKIREIWSQLPKLKLIIVADPTGVSLSDDIVSFSSFLAIGERYQRGHLGAVQEIYRTLHRDDVASIVYTSGTTGRPKGVMLTHKNFLSNVYGVLASADVICSDRFLSVLPLCHVLERTVGHYTPILNGASIYYAESIKSIAADLQLVQPTICIAVPRIFEKIYSALQQKMAEFTPGKRRLFQLALKFGEEVFRVEPPSFSGQISASSQRRHHRSEEYDDPWQQELPPHKNLVFSALDILVYQKIREQLGGRIRYFISGGAPLNAKITEFFRNLGIVIYEGYGLTETTPIVAYNFHHHYEAGAVGRLLPYIDVKFTSEGEILVKGPNIMKGYYKNPKATRDVLDADGWLHTGDIGCFTKRNNLKITGRIKEIIVTSGGKNIPIGPIESVLNQSSLISQGVILGDQKQFISCLIFPDFTALKALGDLHGLQDTDVTRLCENPQIHSVFQKIIGSINEPMSNYEKIKKFKLVPYELSVEAGEITPTLKVKRKVIHEKFSDIIEEIYAD